MTDPRGATKTKEEAMTFILPEWLKMGAMLWSAPPSQDPGSYMVVVVGLTESGWFQLCRVPSGMTAIDLGRRFRHAPVQEDPTAFELLSSAGDDRA